MNIIVVLVDVVSSAEEQRIEFFCRIPCCGVDDDAGYCEVVKWWRRYRDERFCFLQAYMKVNEKRLFIA